MTFHALAHAFADREILPIPVNDVVEWIRQNTDFDEIRLHGVARENKAYRGAFRRRAIARPLPYDQNPEIFVDVLYGTDLPQEWQRLVIVKEILHVYDADAECVDNAEKLGRLIPAMISYEIKGAPFLPAMNDHYAVFRAMMMLLPTRARQRLATAVEDGSRTIDEVAAFTKLPEPYVDLWLRYGDAFEQYFLANP